MRIHSVVRCAAALMLIAMNAAHATEVTFRFRPEPVATSVSLAGAFNGWDAGRTPMTDTDGDGVWQVIVDLPPGPQPYKFVLNATTWVTDETAAAFVDDGFGGRNSVLEVGAEPLAVGGPPPPPPPPSGTPVTFRFRAPGRANAVSVAGSFNGWNAAADVLADPDGDGIWETTLRLEPGTWAFQFVVDGDQWLTDVSASRTESDGFGGRNAVFTVKDRPVTVGVRWGR